MRTVIGSSRRDRDLYISFQLYDCKAELFESNLF